MTEPIGGSVDQGLEVSVEPLNDQIPKRVFQSRDHSATFVHPAARTIGVFQVNHHSRNAPSESPQRELEPSMEVRQQMGMGGQIAAANGNNH